MKFTTLSMVALGFAGFTIGQGTKTTLTTATCINPRSCHGTPTRSNVYTFKTTDSTDLTRTITEFRRQLPTTCVVITSIRSDGEWPTPIATHIQCRSDISGSCSTSYECGCNSTTSTLEGHPATPICSHVQAPLFPPDYGGGRSQRWVARQARTTHAPTQTRNKSKKPPQARATSQDFGGGRSQRRVARQAETTSSCLPGHIGSDCKPFVSPPGPTYSCRPGWFGSGCTVAISSPGNPTMTPGSNINARQEPDGTLVSTPAATTSSIFHCPPGTCGPGCHQGLYCDKQFGRVAEEVEATAVAEEVHGTLLTLRA